MQRCNIAAHTMELTHTHKKSELSMTFSGVNPFISVSHALALPKPTGVVMDKIEVNGWVRYIYKIQNGNEQQQCGLRMFPVI